MYCPQCSAEVTESQKFCKMCGTNMQLVSQAIKRSDDMLGQLGIDVEALKRNALEFAQNLKEGINVSIAKVKDHTHSYEWGKSGKATKELQKQTAGKSRSELRHEKAIRRELVNHSWQHNLKSGLISLFSGAGLGILLYYIGQAAINAGTVANLEQLAEHPIKGLEELLGLIWLVALIPVLKGIAHLIYAAFSAMSGQSLAALAERFPPPQQQQVQELEHFTPSLDGPPPSVTDHTTELFEDAPSDFKREAQTQ